MCILLIVFATKSLGQFSKSHLQVWRVYDDVPHAQLSFSYSCHTEYIRLPLSCGAHLATQSRYIRLPLSCSAHLATQSTYHTSVFHFLVVHTLPHRAHRSIRLPVSCGAHLATNFTLKILPAKKESVKNNNRLTYVLKKYSKFNIKAQLNAVCLDVAPTSRNASTPYL